MRLVQGNTIDTCVLMIIVLWILKTKAGRGNRRDDVVIAEALGMLTGVLGWKPQWS